jgi:5'-3' exoribonuclease 1
MMMAARIAMAAYFDWGTPVNKLRVIFVLYITSQKICAGHPGLRGYPLKYETRVYNRCNIGMGIPHYFHTVTQTHKGILHFSRPRPCDHYYFDYNGAIHHAAQTVLSKESAPSRRDDSLELEQRIYEELWNYTQRCVSVAQPKKHICLSVDGVAPVAKISQQRKRRYLSLLKYQLLGEVPIWDTNAISPGTAFMTRMHAFIRKCIREDAQAPLYAFSTAEEAGEGEHKIFARIASVAKDEVVYIHGLDADLIMLSLMSHHPNIYLMREPSWPYTQDSTEEGFLYLEIDTLRAGLLEHVRTRYGWNVSDAALSDPYGPDACQLIETYVVLCFLLGNDFLPHSPTLTLKKNGHEKLMQVAKEAFAIYPCGAVCDQQVFFPFLAVVLQALQRDEDELLMDVIRTYHHKKPSPKVDQADAYPLLPEKKHRLASILLHAAHPAKWRAQYYKELFFGRLHDTRVVANACQSYLFGVCWTYAYYKRLPKTYDWYYPYGYAPSLLDLSNHLQGTMTEWETLQTSWRINPPPSQFLDPPSQLLCILPRGSMHLIPPSHRKYVTDDSLGWSYMYPSTFEIQTFLHTHLWECVPILPPLDLAWLRMILAST